MTSRFRSADLFHFLLLRRPVRCHDCSHRYHAFVFAKPSSSNDERSRAVLHVRIHNPGRLLRTLLSWLGEPVAEPRIE